MLWSSCRPAPVPEKPQVVPRGYLATLELDHGGQRLGFGPFVGYYFRPLDPADLRELAFVCYNERQFYTRDLPASAKLFEGKAVLRTLPNAGVALPRAERINPVFFDEAPAEWKQSRPPPQDAYVHFHSCYNEAGPVRTGYWLRHDAVADFVYDMSGRVGPDGPLYHSVSVGPDTRFARIIEFDRGPGAR
jgi:hypothetical protein